MEVFNPKSRNSTNIVVLSDSEKNKLEIILGNCPYSVDNEVKSISWLREKLPFSQSRTVSSAIQELEKAGRRNKHIYLVIPVKILPNYKFQS